MAPTASKEDPEESKNVKGEKRKKSDGSSKSDKEPNAKQVKSKAEVKEEGLTPPNIYQEILEIESKESEARPADQDLQLWVETCGELKSMMKDIFELKMRRSPSSEIMEKRIQASLLFVTLKKLNRLEKLRIKKCRDSTNQSKHAVDSFNLQLQNLLYEVLHLRKEVDKCVNFKSADEALSLIPESQFYEEAPDDVARPSVTKEDPHALRLARLQWELERRKELGEDASTREGERDTLELRIRQREDRLRELQPQLAAILETTKPVQEYLGLELSLKRDQNNLARLLPGPLYILYTQVAAFIEACDHLVEIRVKGNAEEARKAREEVGKEEGDDSQNEEVAEQDSQDQDSEGLIKKNRRKKSCKTLEDRRAKLLSKFPLSVHLTVKTKVDGDKIILELGFLPGLGVVVVKVQLELEEPSLSGEALDVTNLLSHLYPDDCGTRSPNPATEHLLAKLGLSEPLSSLLPEGSLLYSWAQQLAGLDFLSSSHTPDTSSSSSVSKLHLETTLRLLRTRLVARIDLQRQLNFLSKTKPNISDMLPTDMGTRFPVRVQSRLKTWSPLDWETYSGQEVTKHLVQFKVVDENDFLFKAQCVREKATLTALVALKPTYPLKAPVFCLSVAQEDKVVSLADSEMLRHLECEVNTGWEDQLGLEGNNERIGLLVMMLHRLLVLFDVYLEVGASTKEEGGFSKSQVWQCQVKGRMRSMPFFYNRDTQSFQQR